MIGDNFSARCRYSVSVFLGQVVSDTVHRTGKKRRPVGEGSDGLFLSDLRSISNGTLMDSFGYKGAARRPKIIYSTW